MKKSFSSIIIAVFFLSNGLYSQTPYLVKNIAGFTADGIPPDGGFIDFNGTLFFRADNAINGIELWKSDGTSGGTVMVKDIVPGAGSSYPDNLMVVNGILYFLVNNTLWKSNGTGAGTTSIKSFTGYSPHLMALNNNVIFFIHTGVGEVDELWISDGTVAGTTMLTAMPIHDDKSYVFNNELFFYAEDPIVGNEIWKTDGTVSGTVLLKDIRTENGLSDDSWDPGFAEYNGSLYFSAPATGMDYELWKTDGTSGGTIMLKDIDPGTRGSYPGNFTICDGWLFFQASISYDSKLFKTDGTASGTVMVQDVTSFHNLTCFENTLFFTDNGYTGNHGHELWKSDGTASGTVMVKDINPNGNGISYDDAFLTEVNGTLFFKADDGIHGKELWKSDSTASGTVMVKDMYPGSDDGFINNYHVFMGWNDKLYFDAINSRLTGSLELWVSDGTSAGTFPFNIHPSGSTPTNPIGIGDFFFFAAKSISAGKELWAIKKDYHILGRVLTEIGTPIPGATLALSGDDTQTYITDSIGRFDFSIPTGGSYTITPSKNNDVVTNNGITSIDVLFTRRHVLGTPFSTPYKIIAADVDSSNSVSTLDILLMRSMILQNISTFPNGRLWSFVPDDYVFADMLNPFPYPSSRTYTNVQQSLTNQNFIGIKLGDVNGSWDPNTP